MCERRLGESCAFTLMLMACAFAFANFAQCQPRHVETAAEIAYGAALMRCVDEAKTLAESKSCRARVDAEWGIVQFTGKDAAP
jgi:hypothetical protein